MPINLYGAGDNFPPTGSHLVTTVTAINSPPFFACVEAHARDELTDCCI
jgi:hypothetical protein